MMSIPKIIEVMSSSVMRYLSWASVTYVAASATKPGIPSDAIVRVKQPDPCGERPRGQPNLAKCDWEKKQGIRTITGEVLHINGARLLVKQVDGEEVILHIDPSTRVTTADNSKLRCEVCGGHTMRCFPV